MTATVTIKGWAGASPVLAQTQNGKPFARLRVASTERYRNDKDEWVDAATDWYTVRVWGERAENLTASVRKGDPLIVTGRLELETWTTTDGEHRSDLILRATALGHDLSYGQSVFRRTAKGGSRVPEDPRDLFRSAAGTSGPGEPGALGGASEADPFAPPQDEEVEIDHGAEPPVTDAEEPLDVDVRVA